MKVVAIALTMVIVGMLFLYPIVPEIFFGDKNDVRVLESSNSPSEIAGVVGESVEGLSHAIDVFNIFVEVTTYIPRFATATARFIIDVITPWW